LSVEAQFFRCESLTLSKADQAEDGV